MEMNIRNVHFRHGDGTLGWPESAIFDRILITAGAPKIPEQLLLNQLREGGIAILPNRPAGRADAGRSPPAKRSAGIEKYLPVQVCEVGRSGRLGKCRVMSAGCRMKSGDTESLSAAGLQPAETWSSKMRWIAEGFTPPRNRLETPVHKMQSASFAIYEQIDWRV